MPKLFLSRSEMTEEFSSGSWQSMLFSELEASLMSDVRPFPCIFGVQGFRSGNIRFAFVDKICGDEVAPILLQYLSSARGFGKRTSLVVFGRPGPVESIRSYEKQFWSLLSSLSELDEKPWPSEIPHEIDHPSWEFCFGGEPIFVVCNTPAHVERQSRRATSFMVTFQPRWVFEGLTDTAAAASKSSSVVRARLRRFDLVDVSPALGRYGDTSNREFRQYFLTDKNDEVECPMHSLRSDQNKKPKEKETAA